MRISLYIAMVYILAIVLSACSKGGYDNWPEEDTNTQINELQSTSWYRTDHAIYYKPVSGTDVITISSIEGVLNNLSIFPSTTILTLNQSSTQHSLVSYFNQSILSSGSYSVDANNITLNNTSGQLLKGAIHGTYSINNEILTITLNKNTILDRLPYNEDDAELLTFSTDSIVFTYTFNKIPFTTQNVFEGTYRGKIEFRSISPINNFEIQMKYQTDNQFLLSLAPFTYNNSTVELKDIPIQCNLKNGIMSFYATNKLIESNGQKYQVTLAGDIKDRKLNISELQAKPGNGSETIYLRFVQ